MAALDLLKHFGNHLDTTRHVALWNVYYFIVLYLSLTGAIHPSASLNFLLLLFIVLPVGGRFSRNEMFMPGKTMVGVLLALLILWHDSWLPSLVDAGGLIQQYGMPSMGYLLSFFRGAVGMSVLVSFAVVLLVSCFLASYKRLSIAVMAVVITVSPVLKGFDGSSLPGQPVGADEAEAAEKDPAQFLESFYAKESERMIVFKQPGAGDPPFDVVVLHLCSMGWDDLREVGVTQDAPIFKEFDYLFTNFNSATGYSGPAVIRLLQSNGGQRSHGEIYSNATPKEYFLFQSLASLGYERYIAMDHDGKYGNYNGALKKSGLNGAKLITHDHLSSSAVFFDGKTQLFNDFSMFKRWFDVRNSSKADRAALYFNSVLMHAGSHWVGEKKWSGRDSREQYKEVSSVALKDVKKMIELLKSTKRNTVLVLVAEHGRALTGSSFQLPDMRDIPLPKITKVPMAVKLIGPGFAAAKVNQTVISKPTSYFALSWLLSKFAERSPFGATAATPQELAAKIPKTEFVAENDNGKIVEIGGVYHYLGKTNKWLALTPAQLK